MGPLNNCHAEIMAMASAGRLRNADAFLRPVENIGSHASDTTAGQRFFKTKNLELILETRLYMKPSGHKAQWRCMLPICTRETYSFLLRSPPVSESCRNSTASNALMEPFGRRQWHRSAPYGQFRLNIWSSQQMVANAQCMACRSSRSQRACQASICRL